MKTDELREVIACLPEGRTLFRYAKDDYAFRVLSRVAGRYEQLADLRKSCYGKLLEKPAVKDCMAVGSSARWFGPGFGVGREGMESYRLTLDEWGDDDSSWVWDQTSRRGKSLVLQLNLTRRHATALRKLMQETGEDPFSWRCHPVREGQNATLAWARLDFDLASGDALIEEIQSDRVNDVRDLMRRRPCRDCGLIHYENYRWERKRVEQFWAREMRRHDGIWAEAMLTAALEFLFDEIGARRVFYHTFETGCHLKGIDGNAPPRSLYTTLPKKFCFREKAEMPEFLARARRRKRRLKSLGSDARFFVMER
jgi:hypothetical protein